MVKQRNSERRRIKAKDAPHSLEDKCPFRKIGRGDKEFCDISNQRCLLSLAYMRKKKPKTIDGCDIFEDGGEETLEEYKRRVYMYDSMGNGGIRDYSRNETLYKK